MTAAFFLTLLDTVDAFLAVAAVAAFVRKSRQTTLLRAVGWGIAASVLVSAAGAWWMSQAAEIAVWERRFAMLAIVAVAAIATFMWRTRTLLIDTAGTRVPPHRGSWVVVFLFTVIVLSREGMHTLVLLIILVLQVPVIDLRIAVVASLACAVGLSWAWARLGHRVWRPWFAAVTAIILLLATSQIVFDAIRSTAAPRSPLPVDVNR